MKLFRWMLAGSIISAFVLIAALGTELRNEIMFGMLGPLLSALVSWVFMIRQQQIDPHGMTRLLIKAFAVKVIFFAIYITVLISSNLVQTVPFALCFAGYYLCLHLVEALGLHRLQAAMLGETTTRQFTADKHKEDTD
ncbi:MAG TPA: hypothetical protein VLL97_07415 [Acidobacteriota bacterium]|nr:hypothetical protein [Acidobacteriota bacterium]